MKKQNCVGCYNDDYNHGLGGATECWHFKDAKLIQRVAISIDQPPPYTQKPSKLPNCYRRQRFVFWTPEQVERANNAARRMT